MAGGHTERAHALLSASGASRWLNCTPSPRLEEGFVDTESKAAAEGTLAHEFANLELDYRVGSVKLPRYNAQIAILRKHELYTSEMEPEVAKYVDYVMEQFSIAKKGNPRAELLVESKLDLTEYIEDGFGTGDATVVSNTIDIMDLKYGKGIQVYARDNPQLMLYGLGALEASSILFDIDTVRLTIVQPRLNHISTWEIPVAKLRAWGTGTVIPKAKLAYSGKGETNSGTWCRWCKAKGKCRALAEKNLDLAKHDFAKPQLLNDTELIDVYSRIDELTSWANAVKDYIKKEALAGKKWEGYKLVEGRSNRKWVDEPTAITKLKGEGFAEDQIITSKLKGIGDIERLVKKTKFPGLLGAFVGKPKGAPTLVPDGDKRSELGGAESAKNDFEEE